MRVLLPLLLLYGLTGLILTALLSMIFSLVWSWSVWEKYAAQKCTPFSKGWLLILLVPFFGKRWFNKLLVQIDEPIFLRTVDVQQAVSQPVIIGNAEWILLEEQYDINTSDHFGSKMIALDHKNRHGYQIITPMHGSPLQRNQIRIMLQGSSMGFEVPWAFITYDEAQQQWKIRNVSHGQTLIATLRPYQQIDQEVDLKLEPLTSDGDPQLLDHGHKLIIGNSEFHLYRLPKLGLSLLQEGRVINTTLLEEKYKIAGSSQRFASIKIEKSIGVLPSHFSINSSQIRVSGEVQAKQPGFIQSQPVRKFKPVEPGDIYQIFDEENVHVEFLVDYCRN